MGVNWVSLAPDSVGWLFGPWTSWAADGDCKSSRIGKVSAAAGAGVFQGSSSWAVGARDLVGLARQTICGLHRRAGRSARGGVSVWTDLTAKPHPNHHSHTLSPGD